MTVAIYTCPRIQLYVTKFHAIRVFPLIGVGLSEGAFRWIPPEYLVDRIYALARADILESQRDPVFQKSFTAFPDLYQNSTIVILKRHETAPRKDPDGGRITHLLPGLFRADTIDSYLPEHVV